jgi:hypothetical protein
MISVLTPITTGLTTYVGQLRAGVVFAAINISPNSSGLPGITALHKIVGAGMTVGLILSVLALIVAAVMWAFGSHSPRHPAKPLAFSSVHRVLTNPCYKGDVTYKGVTYAGTHQPIVPIEVWYRVQTVLSAHNSAGDRRRRHDHHLKGSVYCGACGSRLMISNARSASGNIYPYFACAGRHAKRTHCTRPAILVEKVGQREGRAACRRPLQDHPDTRGCASGGARDAR